MTGPLPSEARALFRDPLDHTPLSYTDKVFINQKGDVYPIRDGIPDFRVGKRPLRHYLWEWVYNLTAFGYDSGARFAWRFALGGAPLGREAFLASLDIRAGGRYLETAVGTGENLLQLPGEAEYAGVDQSISMLRRSRQKLAATHETYIPVLADMTLLPFADDSFDGVFHFGGLQFLSDPGAGVREMGRVVKPGAWVTIADEHSAESRILRRAGARQLTDLVKFPTSEIRCDSISGGELFLIQLNRK